MPLIGAMAEGAAGAVSGAVSALASAYAFFREFRSLVEDLTGWKRILSEAGIKWRGNSTRLMIGINLNRRAK